MPDNESAPLATVPSKDVVHRLAQGLVHSIINLIIRLLILLVGPTKIRKDCGECIWGELHVQGNLSQALASRYNKGCLVVAR